MPPHNGRRPLPTFIPLTDAARLTGLPVSILQKQIETGRMTAIQLPNGEIAVSAYEAKTAVPKEALPEYRKFKHLRGKTIGINEAAREFDVPVPTISRWVKHGYITRLGMDGLKVLLDKQDVAYCAEIYQRHGGQGRRLFNPDGTPYKPRTGPLSKFQ